MAKAVSASLVRFLNADGMVKIKPEPSPAQKKARKPIPAPSEHSDGDEEAPEPARKPPRKKARKSAVNDDDDEDDDEEKEDDERNKPEVDDDADDDGEEPAQRFERDAHGYVPGSIVRIALENFVTYDKVEFRPGPSLNMVLGPNGTGKSTIACAIAIGLGFPPKVLGRSKKVSDYVKTGKDDCWIEIELKGRAGDRNPVIRRHLTRADDKSTYTLDGDAATAKQISEVMAKLNVQVGNLCTFLPQDRVASFAQLAPPDLLKETQKAAGNKNLSQWHATLIETHKKSQGMAKALESKQEDLKRKKTKQAEQEREVKQNDERKELDFEAAVLNLLIPNREYLDARTAWAESKKVRNGLQTDVAQLEEANKPFMNSKGMLALCVESDQKLKATMQKKERKVKEQATAKSVALDSCAKEATKVRLALGDLRASDQQRQAEIKALQKEVDKLAIEVDNKPADPDPTELNALLREKNTERDQITTNMQELLSEQADVKRSIDSLKKDEDRIDEEGRRLQNLQGQAMKHCEKDDPHLATAMKWYNKNKANFKGRVAEPPRFSVRAKEKRFAQLAEAPITRAVMRTFVFEEQADYDYMMAEVNDKVIDGESGRIRVNGAHWGQPRRLADVPRKFSDQQLKDWGFDCLAIDMIEGSEFVLAWLAQEHNLSTFPVAKSSGTIDNAVEASRQVSRYYTPDGSNTVKFSNYGNRASVTEQRELSRSYVFASVADTSKLDELKMRKRDIMDRSRDLKEKHDGFTSSINEFKEQLSTLEEERKKIQEDKEKQKLPMTRWFRSQTRLDTKTKALQKLQNEPSAESKREKLKKDMLRFTEKRFQLTREHKALLFKHAKCQLDSVQVQLRLLQFENDHRLMKDGAEEKIAELDAKKLELEQATAATHTLHAQAQEYMTKVTDLSNAADDDVTEEMQKRGHDDTLEKLQGDLDEVEAQIAMKPSVSAHVLKSYQERAVVIANLEREEAEESAELASVTSIITTTQGKWLPKLEKLVKDVSAKFTKAFQHMGLNGEIRLARNEDYDKWGIEILVAFRDTETVQVLNAQRQSGGERALTTVMYLMALTRLSKSPFALVDEINQGMDQRVERNVHNTLVATTCTDEVGQYFLITPKLLPNLHYSDKMKVLIINNGDWLPPGKVDLATIVKAKVKRNALAARQ